jgi:sarcosine oxidase subunit beta
MALPRTADIVVVGGGVIGASIAFHLARKKVGKVVLLERKHLAAGSTGTSSGLVRMHYDCPLEAQIALKSFEVFRHFDEIVGGDCGLVSTGFIRTVQPHNLEALKANVQMLRDLGANTWLISGDELHQMAPYLYTEDIPFAAYEPDSGYADPHLTTMGFANAARRHGAAVVQGLEVTGINVSGHRVTGIQTSEGEISVPVVVNAAGPWGGLVAAMVGLELDVTIMHHQVAVVETPQDISWPHLTVIDRLHRTYLRPETGRLTLIGASHDNYAIAPERLDTYSESLSYSTLYRVLEHLCARIPRMEDGAARRGHAGIYLDTTDRHALLGPVPGIEGFHSAVGFNGHGFKEAPVLGQAMAEWIVDGRPDVVDLTPLRLARFEEGESVHVPHPYT